MNVVFKNIRVFIYHFYKNGMVVGYMRETKGMVVFPRLILCSCGFFNCINVYGFCAIFNKTYGGFLVVGMEYGGVCPVFALPLYFGMRSGKVPKTMVIGCSVSYSSSPSGLFLLVSFKSLSYVI
jgi:hypothetical protein